MKSIMMKGLDNKELMMFMIIVNSPMDTYNGRYSFLDSIFEKEELKAVLKSLKEKELIFYHIDESDEDHFTAGILINTEVNYAVEIGVMERVGRILDEESGGIIKKCVDAKARFEYDNRIWD